MCEFNIQLQIKERLLLYKVDLVQIGEKILFSRQLQGGLPSYRGGPGHVEGDLTALRSCGLELWHHPQSITRKPAQPAGPGPPPPVLRRQAKQFISNSVTRNHTKVPAFKLHRNKRKRGFLHCPQNRQPVVLWAFCSGADFKARLCPHHTVSGFLHVLGLPSDFAYRATVKKGDCLDEYRFAVPTGHVSICNMHSPTEVMRAPSALGELTV